MRQTGPAGSAGTPRPCCARRTPARWPGGWACAARRACPASPRAGTADAGAGPGGRLGVGTAAGLQLVPGPAGLGTVIIGLDGAGEVHELARRALRTAPGLLSAEFFPRAGLDVLAEHAGRALPLRDPVPAF